MKTEHKVWIESILKKFEFVQWDRFILIEEKNIGVADIFGWIKRDESDYKDFILVEFNIKDKQAYLIATSSDKYSERICKMFNTPHNKCKRVENNFHIENSIKLENKK